MLRPITERDSGGNRRVEQPGAVKVRLELVFVCPIADFDHVFVAMDSSGASVMCIFQADQTCSNKVFVVGADLTDQLIDVQQVFDTLDGFRDQTTKLSEGSLFVVVNVAARLTDEFITRLAV
jgi:hypothetical protein